MKRAVEPAATLETLVSLVVPMVSDAAGTAVEETVASTIGLQSSAVVSVQQGTSVVSVAGMVTPPELAAASVLPILTKAADSGASLSLVALGMNKAVSTASSTTPGVRTSTSVLDEMYRQPGTLLVVPSVSGFTPAITGEGTNYLPDVWDQEYLLLDSDFGRTLEESVAD